MSRRYVTALARQTAASRQYRCPVPPVRCHGRSAEGKTGTALRSGRGEAGDLGAQGRSASPGKPGRHSPAGWGGTGSSTGCPHPSGAVPGAQPVAPPPHSPFWCSSRTSFAIPPAQPGPGSAAERSSPPGLRDRGRAGQAGEPRRTTSGRCQPSLLGSRPRRPLLPCPPPAPLIAPAGRSPQPIQPPGAGVAPPRPSRAPLLKL